MAKNTRKTIIEVIDVAGSFERFFKLAPKIARAELSDTAVEPTTFSLRGRIAAAAPVGEDAPHIKERVEWKVRGLNGQAGYIDATEAAGPGSNASIADVALFNEYRPNRQPFMRPSADAEENAFKARALKALRNIEMKLTVGGL